MINLASMFDSYGRQARLYPGLLTLFPPLLTAIAFFPALITSSIGGTLLTIACSCGLLYGLGVVSRTQGKKVEKRLLEVWGGWPTTIWLRHSSDYLDPQTRSRYHRFLMAYVPGLVLATPDDEFQDPKRADEGYASGVKWLQEQCRGKAFALVERENAEYGFRRNLRGMQPIGLVACLGAILITVVALVAQHPDLKPALTALAYAPLMRVLSTCSPKVLAMVIIDMLAVIGWLVFVTDAWVRDAGDQFARALLANCDALPGAMAMAGSKKIAATKKKAPGTPS